MHFAPQPANDFRRFYETYFTRCRAVCPKIKAVAAKWTYEDLIPGLSDFDTRFIVDNDITLDEWRAYSIRVGEVHTSLATECPNWARNLEHLPGLNLTEAEVTHPLLYYPEFKQWTYYDGDTATRQRIDAHLATVDWSQRDELFHLKKVATYFGPYVRGIDPAINLGPWESKYPLHSRFMHYFTPPVQALVSLAQRGTVCGKFEALRLARHVLPRPDTIDMLLDCVARHYETPALYDEPALTELERQLKSYLTEAWGSLADRVTLVDVAPGDSRDDIRRKVAAVPVDPAESFFEGVKFSRFMKGRLLFYARDIAGFESAFLIRNELGRIVTNFCHQPLQAFGLVRFGETLEPNDVLDRLRGDVLTAQDCAGMQDFAQIAGAPVAEGAEKQRARDVAEVYEPVLSTLEKLSAALLGQLDDSG